MSDGTRIPVFAATTRLEQAGDGWVLRLAGGEMRPNDIAVEVLQLVNGARPVDTIIELLALRYQAPRSRIAADVHGIFDDLARRGALHLREQPQWKLSLAVLLAWIGLRLRRRTNV